MVVLVSCWYEDGPIKNCREKLKIPFSHSNCMAIFHRSSTCNSNTAVRFLWNRYLQVWRKFRSRAHKSWVTGPIPTEFEFDQDLMWVLDTCTLEEAEIKNGWRKSEDTVFPIINLWDLFQRSRVCHSETCHLILLKLKLSRDFMVVLVTCKYEEDPI